MTDTTERIVFNNGEVMEIDEYDVYSHDTHLNLIKEENGLRTQHRIPWESVKHKTTYTELDN